MIYVKPEFPEEEWHAPLLMGLLFGEVRSAFDAEDWGGLRQSHFRVVSAVPEEGVRITDLAQRLGMTKQGVGQFVTHLVGTGHLAESSDPRDRRVRLVSRTRRGHDLIDAVTRRILEIEHGWAETVGQRRYATFRRVLEELAGQKEPQKQPQEQPQKQPRKEPQRER